MRRGPFPEPEKQNSLILQNLSTEKPVGFNELWRSLKRGDISLSFTTLAKTLKRLMKDDYVQMTIKRGKTKIPKRLYAKTRRGAEYEQHLQGKLGFSDVSAKRIIRVREGTIKYNDIIFSNFPFTYELELSSANVDKEAENTISKFVGDMGETLIHNLAEILNKAYSRFLSSFSEGSAKDAFTLLKEGLAFRFRVTLAFDGRRVRLDPIAQRIQSNEDEYLHAVHAVKTPSYTELLGCWMLTLLSPLIPPEEFRYDLATVEGWANLIEEYGNRWRRNKGVPLLKRDEIAAYLNDLVAKGEISIRPVRVASGLLEFKRMPEPQPEEFYSFLLSLFSGMKSVLEDRQGDLPRTP